MEPAAATLSSGTLFEDRYEILGELGSGSFGRVYQARQLSTGQSVAIKVVSVREGMERLRRELQICAALSHPNIVQLIDSGETNDGQLYAVFGHVPGETLEEALARDGALGVKESLRLMTQVLDALACAHEHGIVHRDLKPSNIMLSGTGARRNALVLDFGLGGLAEGPRRRKWRTLTQSQEFVGTPFYAAPEQIAGGTPTPRSDLYAWGLILLEGLTGRHPFEEPGAAARLFAREGGVSIPDWLQRHRLGRLLASVTTPDVEKRDTTAEALIEALDEVGSGELPVAPGVSAPPAPLRERGERRHLTVMFCDLVDSSELSQRLDPEAYSRVIRTYRSCCEDVVARYDGHVAQYLGDGVLVYFGYPQAHEEDAERAVRAAREIVVQVGALDLEQGVPLSARIGIHTGLVVVSESGTGDRREMLALGATPNIAARLQAIAEPDAVVISDATLRLVAGIFEVKDLGRPALKGISEPIRAFGVVRPSGVRSRLDRATRLTPFVGREQELGLLLDRFAQAQEKQGQAVLIAGEAGIGKSRLVHRLRERLRGTPHTWLECRTSPYTRNSALFPVIELVEQGHQFAEVQSSEEKLGRLERGLEHAGLDLTETLPLLAPLLSLELPERYAPLAISPRLQRQRTLEALRTWVLELGERQPVLLVVEDLHWADPTTLEWLGLLIEQCPTAGVLLVMTFRPEFDPPWATRAHLLPIALGRLVRHEAKQLVAAATPEVVLPNALLDEIATRSDGVPLFVEELTRTVVESGRDLGGSLADLEIPETLQDSLMARIDRLGESKQVVQLGAALGREFPYALLEAVAPMKEVMLREGLGRLVDAELLYQRGLPPKATYTFKHTLVQDTAYQSLLASQRRELHGRIADALEMGFPERVAREPEVAAHHCEEARRTAQAIGHYQRAGERATQRSAHAEAIGHLSKGIELVGRLPDTEGRARQELALQVLIGAAQLAAKGYGNPDVKHSQRRARELCQVVGQGPELHQALSGLFLFHQALAELDAAAQYAAELLEIGARTRDVFVKRWARTFSSMACFYRGDFEQALEHADIAIGLYDPTSPRDRGYVHEHDADVASRAYAAMSRWCLGEPDRASAIIEDALDFGRKSPYPFNRAFSCGYAAILHSMRREPARALERAEEVVAVSAEQGFPLWLGLGLVMRGWALAHTGAGDGGLEDLQAGLAKSIATGTRIEGPRVLGVLADVYRLRGRTGEALHALESALAMAARHGCSYWDAELYRLHGEVLLQEDAGAVRKAEDCFRRAVEMARRQKATSLLLRAAVSLADLQRRCGDSGEARALLVGAREPFGEGSDTPDLREADALLAKLA